MTNLVSAEVGKFILSTQRSLGLAFDVEAAMGGTAEGVRGRLIKAVLETLEDYIGRQLGAGWEVGFSMEKAWGSLTIRRANWPMLHKPIGHAAAIRLAPEKGNWRDVAIGFQAHRSEFSNPDRANITEALRHAMPSAVPTDWWPAIEWLGSPLSDWWNRKFLIEIGYAAYCARADGTQPPWEIKELGDRLASIAQAAAKAVPDEWPTMAGIVPEPISPN